MDTVQRTQDTRHWHRRAGVIYRFVRVFGSLFGRPPCLVEEKVAVKPSARQLLRVAYRASRASRAAGGVTVTDASPCGGLAAATGRSHFLFGGKP